MTCLGNKAVPRTSLTQSLCFFIHAKSLHNVDTDPDIEEMGPKTKYGSGLIVTTEPNRLLSFLCDSLRFFVPFL